MSKYPFEPRSNVHLRPGQFWGAALSDGRWACGRVLAVKTESDAYFPGNSRTFLAALMDWEGDEPPTAEAIAGWQVLAQGGHKLRSGGYRARLSLLGRRRSAFSVKRGRAVRRQGERCEQSAFPGVWGGYSGTAIRRSGAVAADAASERSRRGRPSLRWRRIG
jgi:hypothetical protein